MLEPGAALFDRRRRQHPEHGIALKMKVLRTLASWPASRHESCTASMTSSSRSSIALLPRGRTLRRGVTLRPRTEPPAKLRLRGVTLRAREFGDRRSKPHSTDWPRIDD